MKPTVILGFRGAPYDTPGVKIDERWYEPVETRPVAGDLLQVIHAGRIHTYAPNVVRYNGDLEIYDAAKLDDIKRKRREDERKFKAGESRALMMNPTDWSRFRYSADRHLISVDGSNSWRILRRGVDIRPFLVDTYYEPAGVMPVVGDWVRSDLGAYPDIDQVVAITQGYWGKDSLQLHRAGDVPNGFKMTWKPDNAHCFVLKRGQWSE